jgi:hypothetical protein
MGCVAALDAERYLAARGDAGSPAPHEAQAESQAESQAEELPVG